MGKYKLSLWSVSILTALVTGCSTTEVVEPLPKLPEVPNYAHVAHPQGYDLTDIRLMFYSKLAPKPEDMKGCGDEMVKLRTMTTSIDEIATGARELVLKDPVKYHWCFYAKMIEVYDSLKSTDTYWSEKQKKVMEVYLTLVPIARAFKVEYGDVRYLRVANRQYKQMSEWVFYRKVDLTPEGTEELMEDVSSPFSLWKKPEIASESVLEKYGIARTEPSPMGLAMPEDRAPAALKPVEAPTSAPVAPSSEIAPQASTAAPVAPAATSPIVPTPVTAPVAPAEMVRAPAESIPPVAAAPAPAPEVVAPSVPDSGIPVVPSP